MCIHVYGQKEAFVTNSDGVSYCDMHHLDIKVSTSPTRNSQGNGETLTSIN